MAVVLVAAYSCATDMTEDLGVNLTQGHKVTLSIEESRTQLGEKADGVYPVTWCENDAVAINGVASNGITILGNGTAAEFSFATEVARPYNVVYPAPAAGTVASADSLQVVTFPATQLYKAGSFADGAAPMYGYAVAPAEGKEAAPVQLQHLTGVLRFAIKGDATLSNIVVSTEEAKIAGNFDVDCALGAIAPQSDATNAITLSFGDGLALGAEATPIYVAVPAGKHGIYTVTINSTNNEAMVVRFNSDYHAIKAGVVKEFGEVSFTPNASNAPEGELVITNEAELRLLAKFAEVGQLQNVTSVRVGATIDLSNATNWKPINNFTALTFDGGSDKGYEIKGLKAPLFNDIYGATIKNVKLTDVNIIENESLYYGAIVCQATASTINNCSVSGNVVYNNTAVSDFTTSLTGSETDSVPDDLCIGGVAGLLRESSITNCTNYSNITIEEYVVSTSTTSDISVGGIVGSLICVKDNYGAISNCHNKGVIASNASKGKLRPNIGGVAGYIAYVNISNISNGEQGTTKGSITLENILGNCTRLGGIIGATRGTTVDGATNYAPLEYKAMIQYPYAGGMIGQSHNIGPSEYKNLTNYGTFTTASGSTAVGGTPYLGGILGRQAGTCTMENCDNYGAMNVGHLATGDTRVAGVIAGGETVSCEDCDNYGAITFNGKSAKLYVAGIAGRIGTLAPKFNNNDNNAPISITTTSTEGYIGGVAGYLNTGTDTWTANTNGEKGDITLAGEFSGNCGVCGLAAYCNDANSDCSNAGDVVVTATNNTGSFYIGGHSWTGNQTISNFTNSGDIVFGGTLVATGKSVFIYGTNYTPSKVLTNIHNTGDIKITKDAVINGDVKMGGFARSTGAATYVNCSNSGDIIFEGTLATSDKALNMGCIAGDANAATKFQGSFTNSGDVIFAGDIKGIARIGGLYGFLNGATAVAKAGTIVKNSGNVYNYITKDGVTKVGKATILCLGGIAGMTFVNQTVEYINVGNIYARNAEGAYTTGAYIGGISGCNTLDTSSKVATTPFVTSNAKCVCDIEAIGFVESAEAPIVGVGMITGSHRGTNTALVGNCQLGGRIAFTEEDGAAVYKPLTSTEVTKEDADNNIVPDPAYIAFYKKIYGGEWAAASETNTDNCIHIDEIE